MTDGYYFDRQGQPIDVYQWETLHANRDYVRVAKDDLDGCSVSTVWLGINHQFLPDRPPLVFETMVFGGPDDRDCWRYSTETEAVAGHAKVVGEQRAKLADGNVD